MHSRFQITEYCHHFLKEYIQENDCCVDATAGNGNDTEFLCQMVGEGGKVYAFDVQEEALKNTRERLQREGLEKRTVLIHDGHEKLLDYVKEEIAAVVFNFGYLPGGDHRISTKAETSIRAVEQGLSLLKKGGVMSLCIYSGGDTGYEEKHALLSYLQGLDSKKWLVLVHSFYNRKNDPPLPVFIIRLR
ncbi:MAG: class I SAM-dependent methyltransferase [Bariatricus sp.]|nr:class I SAM-dependent methyltransferase [Bariatricus sp.]